MTFLPKIKRYFSQPPHPKMTFLSRNTNKLKVAFQIILNFINVFLFEFSRKYLENGYNKKCLYQYQSPLAPHFKYIGAKIMVNLKFYHDKKMLICNLNLPMLKPNNYFNLCFKLCIFISEFFEKNILVRKHVFLVWNNRRNLDKNNIIVCFFFT